VGAAAGIAAAFNAPIAAVTFTVEEVVGDLDHTVLAGVVVAAALAAAIEHLALGSRPVFDVPADLGVHHADSMLLYLVLGVVAAGVQSAVVLFVAFFLLSSGDTFRRKMVKMAGPTFGRKKLTLQALDEIDGQIQRYLLVQVFTSAIVGAATWLVFLWLGVEHAAVWGAVSFVLNFIPYLGSIVVAGGSALMGFVQFGTFEMALAIGGAVLVIHSLEGYLLTPLLTSRASRMNPVAVFVGVLAWGWLWGAWGLFLGVPILTAIKAVCDRVEDFKPVGELLGRTLRSPQT